MGIPQAVVSSAPLAPFVPGTLADGVVYVSGTLPFDKDNNVVFINDPKAQTRHVLETIKSVIETAGGTMEDVTFNSIFITDWKNYAAINEIYAEFFPGMPKTWALTFMINEEEAPTGRPAGALAWAGLANLYYWIDRANGIGGYWATQIFPFVDPTSVAGYLAMESATYQHAKPRAR